MGDSHHISDQLGYSLNNGGAHYPSNNNKVVIPPTSITQPGGGGMPTTAPPPFDRQSILHDTPYIPTYNPGNGGLVLALNPSQNGEFHNPFSQNQPIERPWWMWLIAIIDIIAAVFWACRVGMNVTSGEQNIGGDPSVLMWVLFLIFISLAGQFMMGLCLLIGLKSTNIETTLWVCQGWICGAYCLFFESAVTLLGINLTGAKVRSPIGANVLFTVKIIFRLISFILVKKFMKMIAEKNEENDAAKERYRHYYHQQQQQHHQQQHQPLLDYNNQMTQQQGFPQHLVDTSMMTPQQQFHFEQQLFLQQQQRNQMQQQQQSTTQSGGTASNNTDFLYFAPQMSFLMSLMNNTSGSSAN